MALHFTEALLPQGWAPDVRIELAGGLIAQVMPDAPAQPGDARHGVGLPGLSNLHSHAFQRGMAGLSEVRGPASDSFWTWREVMYRFLGRMSPDDVQAVTALAYAEMLEGGFTRVGEFHYLHHDIDGTPYADIAEMAGRIVAASAETGIALTLLPVFYAHGGFGAAPATPGQRRFVTGLDLFARLLDASEAKLVGLPRAGLGVAPHSLRAVTPAQLAAVTGLRPVAPVHMHIAEQVLEVEDCRAWSGQTPVDWLLSHEAVEARWCLIHATHMTPAETSALARSGAVAGLCPITEASLGDGIFRGPEWVQAGGHYGVGTDSNVLVSAAAELRQLEYAQRLAGRARNVMATGEGCSTGRALFEAARNGGAEALGVAASALQAGAAADLVALDGDTPALAGRHGDALLDAWIFAGGAVTAVWADGRQVVADGRHVARAAIASRYRVTLDRLLAA